MPVIFFLGEFETTSRRCVKSDRIIKLVQTVYLYASNQELLGLPCASRINQRKFERSPPPTGSNQWECFNSWDRRYHHGYRVIRVPERLHHRTAWKKWDFLSAKKPGCHRLPREKKVVRVFALLVQNCGDVNEKPSS